MLALAAAAVALVPALSAASDDQDPAARTRTATAIKHLVVIFQENISFDHYFGTYPQAANPAGEPAFHASTGTPTVNGLGDAFSALRTRNPNLSNPQRLDRSQAHTCDQDHDYSDEQKAVDLGAMDQFVQHTSATTGKDSHPQTVLECTGQATGVNPNFAVMDYYDGNTVTALWNYAQRFAMSDNSFGTSYGPSTPGALNLISGNTFGAVCGVSSTINSAACPMPFSTDSKPGVPAQQGSGTVFGDPQPFFDSCLTRGSTQMGGRNVGDLLSARGLTWGWFQGGFANCSQTHTAIGATPSKDYIPHHQPFQYYQSTSNPKHLPPSSDAMIGHQDQANHQYDLSAFWKAADANRMPSVSFLKAAAFQDGHAGYSDPLDEQTFLVDTINHLESLQTWHSTAVIVVYDDSDGWYDHVLAPLVDQSQTSIDFLTGQNQCGPNPARVPTGPTGPQQTRCGYGPRLPLLVISPFARQNFVDHTLTDQSSVLRLIEDNWSLGLIGNGSTDAFAGSLTGMFDFNHPRGARLVLDSTTGLPVGGQEDN